MHVNKSQSESDIGLVFKVITWPNRSYLRRIYHSFDDLSLSLRSQHNLE